MVPVSIGQDANGWSESEAGGHRGGGRGGERRWRVHSTAERPAPSWSAPAAVVEDVPERTCEQSFTGAMRFGLANAWWLQVRDRAAEDPEGLAAAHNLADALSHQGKRADAEEMQREVLAMRKRVLGAQHPDTLTAASNLAISLSHQGKRAEAEEMQREVLAVWRRVLGAQHPDTLTAASNLAISLSRQKHAEAEEMQHEVLAVWKRVPGVDHPDTLTAAGNLGISLFRQGKHAEAEEMRREMLAILLPSLADLAPFLCAICIQVHLLSLNNIPAF